MADEKSLGGLDKFIKTIGVVNPKRQAAINKVGKMSVATPDSYDGSFQITASMNPYVGGVYSSFVDIDTVVKSDQQAITTFRQIATYSDCERAIDELTNDGIVKDPSTGRIVEIDLTHLNGVSDKLKDQIREEFETILSLLNFHKDSKKIWRQWYIDGKIFYRTAVDEKNRKAGIQRLELISPLKIMKIKEVEKKREDDGIEYVKNIEEYYLFNDNGLGFTRTYGSQDTNDIKIPVDDIVEVDSGWMDLSQRRTRSFLLGAIRPVNILKMMEDAVVIYRMTRAPERRIFYIDVGEMNAEQAEQHTNKFKTMFRNRITYNPTTGSTTDKKRFVNAMEDYYVPRRGEGKGTEITTLPGASNLGEITDLTFFKELVWDSLKVPTTRLKKDTPFSSGRGTAITQEETKFQKYIQTLRESFSEIFLQSLERQLTLKNIFDFEDWMEIEKDIRFKFVDDAMFLQAQNQERLSAEAEVIGIMDPFVGKYYSKDDVMRGARFLSDDEIKTTDAKIEEEVKLGLITDHKKMKEIEMRTAEGQAKSIELQNTMPQLPPGGASSPTKPKPKPKTGGDNAKPK